MREQLTQLSEAQLLCFKGIGRTALASIREVSRGAGRPLRGWTVEEYAQVPEGRPRWLLDDHDLVLPPRPEDQRPVIRARVRYPGVYFIQSGAFIKIGLSVDVPERMFGLLTMNPNLDPVGYIPCQAEDLLTLERRIHREFAAYRQRGEWFREHLALAQFMGEHAVPWPTDGGEP